MDKLKMAHDYLLKTMKETAFVDESDICFFVDTAWKYADAMQAEAEKRNKAEAAQKRKEIREMLDAPNTFVEREGQHFDDVESLCEVDWSQSPSNAEFYLMRYGKAVWSDGSGIICPAPSFGFTGTHIVERPNGF